MFDGLEKQRPHFFGSLVADSCAQLRPTEPISAALADVLVSIEQVSQGDFSAVAARAFYETGGLPVGQGPDWN